MCKLLGEIEYTECAVRPVLFRGGGGGHINILSLSGILGLLLLCENPHCKQWQSSLLGLGDLYAGVGGQQSSPNGVLVPGWAPLMGTIN